MKSLFTPEELAKLAAADAEIDASFCLTNEDIRRSREADKDAMLDRLPPEKRTQRRIDLPKAAGPNRACGFAYDRL